MAHTRYTEHYSKLYDVLSMMSYFGLREWKFCNENINELANLLKSQSKKNVHTRNITTDAYRWQNGIPSIKPTASGHGNSQDSSENVLYQHRSLEFDMRTIDWKEYFFHYMPGIKKYFFKEPVNEKCIRHVRRYTIMSYCVFLLDISHTQR